MVDGEAPYQVKTGKSLVACQAMEPGGSGGVSLGDGGGFEMDSSQIGEAGVPMQAVVSYLKILSFCIGCPKRDGSSDYGY